MQLVSGIIKIKLSITEHFPFLLNEPLLRVNSASKVVPLNFRYKNFLGEMPLCEYERIREGNIRFLLLIIFVHDAYFVSSNRSSSSLGAPLCGDTPTFCFFTQPNTAVQCHSGLLKENRRSIERAAYAPQPNNPISLHTNF